VITVLITLDVLVKEDFALKINLFVVFAEMLLINDNKVVILIVKRIVAYSIYVK
jgi:hypothetical protein